MVQNRLRRPAASPRFFNEDWFSGHIPLWETLFADRKGCPRLAGLEIGSYEGRSASWLLEREHEMPQVTRTMARGQIFTNAFIKRQQADRVSLEIEKISYSRCQGCSVLRLSEPK